MGSLVTQISFLALIALTRIGAPAKVSQEERFRLLMEEVYDLLETPFLDKKKLDKVLQSGELGGFYSAYEYFDFIKSLRTLYPNYITNSIACGKSYQSREIKAYRIGDLSNFIRKPFRACADSFHRHSPCPRTAGLVDDLADNAGPFASIDSSKKSRFEGRRRDRS